MAENSKIEWTEATWNPLAGCSLVSPECLNCYAMLMAHRLAKMGQAKYQGLTEVVQQGSHKGKPVWTGLVRLDHASLDVPINRKKPTLYFVNSMSDMFHESLPSDDICQIWTQMVVADWHTYQVLTKRPHVMKQFVNGWIAHMRAESKAPVKNIWLGTSVGNKAGKRRIDFLRETNAAVRFLSCEPLIEDLGQLDLRGIHWVIVGGESGPGARPCQIEWMRSIVNQCKAQKVPVFVKQLGARPQEVAYPVGVTEQEKLTWMRDGWTLIHSNEGIHWRRYVRLKDKKGGDFAEWPAHLNDLKMREFPAGKPDA